MGPEREMMIWAEMTDRFGGRWALMDMGVHYELATSEYLFHIFNMKYYFTEPNPNDQSYSDQSDSDQSDSD